MFFIEGSLAILMIVAVGFFLFQAFDGRGRERRADLMLAACCALVALLFGYFAERSFKGLLSESLTSVLNAAKK